MTTGKELTPWQGRGKSRLRPSHPDQYSTVTEINRPSTVALRRSTLDVCLGGQRSSEWLSRSKRNSEKYDWGDLRSDLQRDFFANLCVNIYVYIYICIYVFIYVYGISDPICNESCFTPGGSRHVPRKVCGNLRCTLDRWCLQSHFCFPEEIFTFPGGHFGWLKGM